MVKKILLITAFIIFAVSCSKTPTDPNNNGSGNTGDGGIIEEGTGTSDSTSIADFLKKHEGRYYEERNDGYIYVNCRIENGEIYESYNSTPISGTKILSGNKLQIQYKDSYNNEKIYIFNFIDGKIYEYNKSICKKDNFSELQGFIKVGTPISSLAQYSGNYYTLYNQEKEYSYILIGNDGQIYAPNYTDESGTEIYKYKNVSFANNTISISMSYSYQGESAEITITYLIKDGRLIDGDQYINGKLDSTELKKSDLLNDYIGTSYSSADGVTLNIYQDYAGIIGRVQVNGSTILLGNTMTISQYVQSSSSYKIHTIVFSDDKQTATYTDPDTKKEITLTKQGA